MSNGNSSYLRFSVEESIWFQKGHEVEELVSISLSPDVVIQETREYVLIRGSLELTGEYQSKLDMDNVIEFASSGEKFMEILEVKENGNCFFRYYFPVDITIRREKIVNVHHVDFLVDNFDYTFPERSCLKLTANLLVTGLMEETTAKPDLQNYSQPAIFTPTAQARKPEVAVPTPAVEVANTVNEEEREVLLQEAPIIEEVETQVESNHETQASNLEEIVRLQTDELTALTDANIEEAEVEELVREEEVMEEELIEEQLIEEQVLEEVIVEEELVFEEEVNDVEIEVVFEEQTQEYVEEEIAQEELYIAYEETVEEAEPNDQEIVVELEPIYEETQEESYIAYEDTTEEAYPVYEEVKLATFPVYEEVMEETPITLVEEVTSEIINVQEVEVAPPVSEKKSRFGFDIFLSNKNKKEGAPQEKVEAKVEEVEKKKSTNINKTPLTEYFSSKTEESNVNLKLYFVQPNDTLEKIAEKYNTTLINLLKYNKLDSANQLVPGDILYVPRVTVKK